MQIEVVLGRVNKDDKGVIVMYGCYIKVEF